MSAILQAAAMLFEWSYQVEESTAEPGAIEAMRQLATEAREEYSRLRSPAGEVEALLKAWAYRELDALPRGAHAAWIRTGVIPVALQHALARLPEPVVALVLEYIADELGQCEACHRQAPIRLTSDGTDSGESDWLCAWGCWPPDERETNVANQGSTPHQSV